MKPFRSGPVTPVSFIVDQQTANYGTEDLKEFVTTLPGVTGAVDVHNGGTRQVRVELMDKKFHGDVVAAIDEQFPEPEPDEG